MVIWLDTTFTERKDQFCLKEIFFVSDYKVYSLSKLSREACRRICTQCYENTKIKVLIELRSVLKDREALMRSRIHSVDLASPGLACWPLIGCAFAPLSRWASSWRYVRRGKHKGGVELRVPDRRCTCSRLRVWYAMWRVLLNCLRSYCTAYNDRRSLRLVRRSVITALSRVSLVNVFLRERIRWFVLCSNCPTHGLSYYHIFLFHLILNFVFLKL